MSEVHKRSTPTPAAVLQFDRARRGSADIVQVNVWAILSRLTQSRMPWRECMGPETRPCWGAVEAAVATPRCWGARNAAVAATRKAGWDAPAVHLCWGWGARGATVATPRPRCPEHKATAAWPSIEAACNWAVDRCSGQVECLQGLAGLLSSLGFLVGTFLQ